MISETEINMAAVSDNLGSKDKDIIMAKENELDKLAQFGTYEGSGKKWTENFINKMGYNN